MGGRRLARDAADAVWSLLFPERCVGCGMFETQLCDGCRSRLEPMGDDVCRRCGHPLGARLGWPPRDGGPRGAAAAGALGALRGHVEGVTPGRGGVGSTFCPRCAGLPLGFVRARSAFAYDGVARLLVSALKHEGRRNLGALMADLAGESFGAFLQAVEHPVVTWVPAHGSSIRSRGYNQSEVLARHLAREAGGVPVIPLVRKVTRTRHQKALGREQRRRNLRGAFEPLSGSGRSAAAPAEGGPLVPVGPSAEGVVMVDDVYTTGATAQEVAGVIGRSTGLPVHVFTFCRTVAVGDGSLA